MIDRDLDLAIFEFAPGAVIVKDKQQHRCIGFTGPLENPFRPGSSKRPRNLAPYTSPFGEPFWLLHCDHCGSWHRYDQKPTGADCKSCRYVLPDDTAGECRTPNGFRTDLRPGLITGNDSFGRSHRSITAEYQHLTLTNTKGNLSYEYKPQVRTYRLNRGPDATPQPGAAQATGFNVDCYSHPIPGFRNTRLMQQMLDTANTPAGGYQPDTTLPPLRNLWLAAPKTTDALFVAATRVPSGLRIDRVSGLGHSTAVRAAALSAAFILVQRAALDLDIDPEEFDIVDPRTHILDGASVPVLQITDHLINGSGFCERLESLDASGQARLVSMIESIVTDPTAFPLKEFVVSTRRQFRPCEAVRPSVLLVSAAIWQPGISRTAGLAIGTVVSRSPPRSEFPLRFGRQLSESFTAGLADPCTTICDGARNALPCQWRGA